jgi:hypothetical protein
MAAIEACLKDHDPRLTARTLLARKLGGRRSTSRLPACLNTCCPADRLGRHDRGGAEDHAPAPPKDLVAEFGLREGDRERAILGVGRCLDNGQPAAICVV